MKKSIILAVISLFLFTISSCSEVNSDFERFIKEYENYFSNGYDPDLKWYEVDYVINYYSFDYSRTKTISRSIVCQVDFDKNSWSGQLKRYFMTTTTTEIISDEIVDYEYIKCYNDKFLDTKNHEYYYYVKNADTEQSYGLKEVNFKEKITLPISNEIFNPKTILKKYENQEDYVNLRVGTGYVGLTKVIEDEQYFVEIKENYFFTKEDQAALKRVEINRQGSAKSVEFEYYSEYIKLKLLERNDFFTDPADRLQYDLPLIDYPKDDLNMVKKV